MDTTLLDDNPDTINDDDDTSKHFGVTKNKEEIVAAEEAGATAAAQEAAAAAQEAAAAAEAVAEAAAAAAVDANPTAANNNAVTEEARKRTSNSPYDTNSTWICFDSNHLSAFKQTPERLNLDGKAFFISVQLKVLQCRLNIGDIVTKSDNTKAVFLGVRLLAVQDEEEDKTLLYFCALPRDDICEGNHITIYSPSSVDLL